MKPKGKGKKTLEEKVFKKIQQGRVYYDRDARKLAKKLAKIAMEKALEHFNILEKEFGLQFEDRIRYGIKRREEEEKAGGKDRSWFRWDGKVDEGAVAIGSMKRQMKDARKRLKEAFLGEEVEK